MFIRYSANKNKLNDNENVTNLCEMLQVLDNPVTSIFTFLQVQMANNKNLSEFRGTFLFLPEGGRVKVHIFGKSV